jgi:hypothetical protein
MTNHHSAVANAGSSWRTWDMPDAGAVREGADD